MPKPQPRRESSKWKKRVKWKKEGGSGGSKRLGVKKHAFALGLGLLSISAALRYLGDEILV